MTIEDAYRGYGAEPSRGRQNGRGIAGFVTALAGLVLPLFVLIAIAGAAEPYDPGPSSGDLSVIYASGLAPAIVGLVLSVMSRRQAGPTGLATAGLVIGIIGCSIWGLTFALALIWAIAAA